MPHFASAVVRVRKICGLRGCWTAMDIGLSIMIRCLASECPRPQRADQFDGRAMMAGTTHHKVLFVGGGTAGITAAASLKRHRPGGIDIAIVEPSATHHSHPPSTLTSPGVTD